MCRYLALLSNGPKVTVMYNHFSFKGPPTSLISSASFFNLGFEAFFGWLSGDETEFWATVTACPPNWGVWSAADTALVASLFYFVQGFEHFWSDFITPCNVQRTDI